MPIANYRTEQAVDKTMAEVVEALRRRGVTRISTTYDGFGTAAGLEFSMMTEYGERHFALPVRTSGVLAALQADPKVSPAGKKPEHAARVAWAIARDWLRAQSALIDAGLATLDEVMFPWMLGGQSDQTAFETYRGQQKAIES